MQDIKLNKNIEQFLEVVQYDTNFVNNVFFGTGIKNHNKLGSFKSIDHFRQYLKRISDFFSIFIVVGNEGSDDYNTSYSLPAPFGSILYFKKLKNAVDFCSIFGNKKIAISDDLVIDSSIDLSNKSIVLQSGNELNKKISVEASKAFIADGQVNLKIKNITFEGIKSSDIVSLIGFRSAGCINLNLCLENCNFISSKNNIKSMDIIGLAINAGLSGIINLGLKRNAFYVTDKTNEYMVNRQIPIKSCCWIISAHENLFYNESTGVEFNPADPQSTIIDPDIVQLHTIGGLLNVPSNIMTNDKRIMGLL